MLVRYQYHAALSGYWMAIQYSAVQPPLPTILGLAHGGQEKGNKAVVTLIALDDPLPFK